MIKFFFSIVFVRFSFWEQELGQVLRHSSQVSVFLNQWAQGSTPTRFFNLKEVVFTSANWMQTFHYRQVYAALVSAKKTGNKL